jgi:hypothetical protein
MSISYNPSVTVNGLISSIDFANPKCFQPRENLFTYSENLLLASVSNSTQNAFFISTATTLTPIGTTASTLIINTSTTNQFNYISGGYLNTLTGYYTMSYYIKPYSTSTITMILGTNGFNQYAGSGTVYATVYVNPITTVMTVRGLSNSNTNINTIADFTWGSVPSTNGWTRYWMTVNLTTTTGGISAINGGFYIGDPGSTGLANGTGVYTWGWQLESSNTANTYVSTTAAVVPKNYVVIDQVSRNQAVSYYQSNYISSTPGGYVQFNRFPATTSTQKAGGNLQITNPQGAMSVTNFLYGDHTWEIWARIDDRTPTAADVTEGSSGLAIYNGYHAGWYYSSTLLNYLIWSSATATVSYINWSVGASGAQINQGAWYQMVVSKVGNTATGYINGSPVSVVAGALQTTNVPTNNNINFGSAYPAAIPSANSYLVYSKSSLAISRQYNRGLSAQEIQANFAANRGRFGI